MFFMTIDYFEDLLINMQKLPPQVKITLCVDANYSGIVVDKKRLDTYLRRGNYEIITATDTDKTTPYVSYPEEEDIEDIENKELDGAKRETFIEILLETCLSNNVNQTPGKPIFKADLANIIMAVLQQAEKFKYTFPEPQYAPE